MSSPPPLPSPSGSSATPRTHTTVDNTSRKGGTPHRIREWHSVAADSTVDPSQPSPDRVSHRCISISTWTITTSRGAIGNSAYMENLGDRLAVPPPEMVFPSNTLVVRHEPSGFEYRFVAEDALRCVDGVQSDVRMQGFDLSADWRSPPNSETSAHPSRRANLGEKPKKKGKGIKVAYADEWGKSRSEPSASASSDSAAAAGTSAADQPPPTTAFGAAAATQIADARDYDWTYSTTWGGDASTSSSSFTPGNDPSEDRIPVERLGPSSGEPILFYDDLVLFEDELGDNGSSMLGVKIRVMPSGFLILQRFFLRVDDVVFRLFDVRMYCAFNEGAGGGANANGATVAASMTTARPTTTPTPTSSLDGLSLGPTRRTAAAAAAASSSSSSPPPQKLIRECSGCEAPYKDVKSVSTRAERGRSNDKVVH